jgi:regulatory protein
VNSSSEPVDPDADPEEVARTIVLRLLTGQARTRGELAEALRRRNVPTEAADAVLVRMTEVGLIDDTEFARSWVDSRQQRRHLSRMVLRRELRGRGVADEVVDEAVAGVTAADELQAAKALAEKKLRSMRGLDAQVQRRRLAAALARRGFAADMVRAVLRELDVPSHGEGDIE